MDKTVYSIFHSICVAKNCCGNVTFLDGSRTKDEAGASKTHRLNSLLTLRNSLGLGNPGQRGQKTCPLALEFCELLALGLDHLRLGILDELLVAKL